MVGQPGKGLAPARQRESCRRRAGKVRIHFQPNGKDATKTTVFGKHFRFLPMKTRVLSLSAHAIPPAAAAGLILLLAGCETRSISDSGYRHGESNPFYRGELTEAEVVGSPDSATHPITDADIQRALHSSKPVHATPGTGLAVVQSGALTPDDAMIQALNTRYRVQPFSGLPDNVFTGPSDGLAATRRNGSYSKQLRLAAAQGGLQHILCYWGTLESARENQVTKAVSWVPIAGNFVPDENQRMRINLHAVLIDVATGHWSPYTGKPSEDAALSANILRGSSDQKQVAKLKGQAYASLVDELVARSI